MAPPRIRPPSAVDERSQLVGRLDAQRALVHATCEGLADGRQGHW